MCHIDDLRLGFFCVGYGCQGMGDGGICVSARFISMDRMLPVAGAQA